MTETAKPVATALCGEPFASGSATPCYTAARDGTSIPTLHRPTKRQKNIDLSGCAKHDLLDVREI